MSSSNVINFSVRQNKAIERSMAFESLRRLVDLNHDLKYIYVGLGSIWFVDFDMAHRELGIDAMFSIESNPIMFERAVYNSPFRSIKVRKGLSHDELPALMSEQPELVQHPWIVWLDYDEPLDTAKLAELGSLIVKLPPNSVLMTTFNAYPGSYARKPADRKAAFEDLFGDSFPTEQFTATSHYKDEEKVMAALSEAVNTHLQAFATQTARPGGFVRAFDLRYKDGSPMVTAGGLLPAPDRLEDTVALVASEKWKGFCPEAIITPPLTVREIHALRALMPCEPMPTRADVQGLGFDLEEGQIAAFVAHYTRFPTFVQALR